MVALDGLFGSGASDQAAAAEVAGHRQLGDQQQAEPASQSSAVWDPPPLEAGRATAGPGAAGAAADTPSG
ncbi:MAG: hypothetical protein ACR2HY_04085 [Acidimicrobiales bacterium]